ncbi:hypothetical protein BgAZ_301200 [Babesia gibsoni]|uniref:Uncharacterized protein n=1 Tax=Babesia gibsoni TaxID=33632 RepID=A0AAD8LQN3_BABGI|nr:hypothetical protein BgAZ_301200 [Babesia gibsoni]
MQSLMLHVAAFLAAIVMVSAKGGKPVSSKPASVLPMDYKTLRHLDRNERRYLNSYKFKQPDENDPSAHSAHRAVIKWEHRGNKQHVKIPLVKFWRRGEMDHVQLTSLNDISLVFTVLEQNDKSIVCNDQKITVTIEHMKIGEDGLITEKKEFASHTIRDRQLTKAGHRFRLRYRDVFKKTNSPNPREFFVRVTSTERCIHWFLVELEEPNNYGDMVAPAT